MANPYSKYTGARIQPLPPGYLASNAQAAAALQKGLASIGQAIGDYYGNKRKKEQDEIDKAAVGSWVEDHASTLPSGVQFKDDESGEVEAIPGYTPPSPIEAYKRNVTNTKSTFQGWMEEYGNKVSDKAMSHVQGLYFNQLKTHRDNYVDDEKIADTTRRTDAATSPQPQADPEQWRLWEKMKGEMTAAGASAEDIQEAFKKRFDIGSSAEASALSEKIGLLDALKDDMGWDAKTLAQSKARIIGALKPDSSVPANLQYLEAMKGMDWYKKASKPEQEIFDQKLLGIFSKMTDLEEKDKFVTTIAERLGLDNEAHQRMRMALVNVSPDDTRSDKQILLDDLKKTAAWESATPERRREMTEELFGVAEKRNTVEVTDGILQQLTEEFNIPADQSKLIRLKALGGYLEGAPQDKVLTGLKQTALWKNATEAERKQMEAKVYGAELPDNREWNRDVKAGAAYIEVLKAQGNVSDAVIEQLSKAKTLTSMKTIFQNLPDDSVLPAEIQAWNSIEKNLKAQGADVDEINKYFKIHYGLEERSSPTTSQKELAAYQAMLEDPNTTDEQKLRAAKVFGIITTNEAALGAYEKWENGVGKDATNVEKTMRARALGLIGPLDAMETLLDIKLKRSQLKEDRELAKAVAEGKVQTREIPGAPDHLFVRASNNQGWQLISTKTGSRVRDVTEEEAVEWNKILEREGFDKRWMPAPSRGEGEKTFQLVTPGVKAIEALIRSSLFGSDEGGGGTGGVVPVPKSQLSAEEQGYEPGYIYARGNKVYQITPNGGRVQIRTLDNKGEK